MVAKDDSHWLLGDERELVHPVARSLSDCEQAEGKKNNVSVQMPVHVVYILSSFETEDTSICNPKPKLHERSARQCGNESTKVFP